MSSRAWSFQRFKQRYAAARQLRRAPPPSLRSHFLFIVLVAFVPLLAFSAATVVLVSSEQRHGFQRGATERTRALLTAIDTELKRSVAALEALAASEHLDTGDLAGFRSDARRVLKSRQEWLNVHLAPPSGEQLVNLIRPPGASFHRAIDARTFEQVLQTRRPVIGNLYREPFTALHVFAVRVPVVREGGLRYVLSALVDPQVVGELLLPQGLPPDWVGVVLDASGTIVARTVGPELVGRPASDDLRAASKASPEGWFKGATVEGWPVYTPFNRSSFSGWTVAMGIPEAAVEGPLRRSLAAIGGLVLGLLALGIVLAWLLSLRSTRSLQDLAGRVKDLGMERPPEAPEAALVGSTGIAEIDELRAAFLNAAELIRARSGERDRVEASLRRAESDLRASEQRKDEFLAMLGHELRNPLGVIATAIDVLRERSGDDSMTAQARGMIERQVKHMARLLDDLLDVSRIAEGRVQVSPKPCDLVDLVQQTVDDHRQLLQRCGLDVDVRVPSQPMWVTGDRIRLTQALGNLLQNATKYTDPGGKVTVSLSEARDGAWSVLAVRDTGVGMEPDVLEHAFEPFSQADRTIARSRGGLGLGLALVKGLVELHGGSVRAASGGLGEGTEVVIELPLGSAPPTPRPVGVAPEPARPRRVLLIEDNDMAALSLRLCLERLGHTVEVTHSGPEGVAAARGLRPDVVLCDIGLPGVDGYEVARALRRIDGLEDLHLIALSGYGQEADRQRARAAGFDEHLTKPVDLESLQRMLVDFDPAA